jgi:hypothetical protein
MRRRLLLSLVVLLFAASAAKGVHASTDCERWFIAYKSSLAQTKAAKQLRIAKHRVRGYVHRKLATYRKPKPTGKPRVLAAHARRPKMSREEMLRHFNLACGEFPDNLPAQVLQAEKVAPDFLSGRPLLSDVAQEDVPNEGLLPPSSPGNSGWSNPFNGGVPPFLGGGGGGGGGNPGGSGPGGPGNPGGPGSPGNPPGGDNPPPVIPPVPEPSSVVLLLTGIAGAAGIVRRRLRQS